MTGRRPRARLTPAILLILPMLLATSCGRRTSVSEGAAGSTGQPPAAAAAVAPRVMPDQTKSWPLGESPGGMEIDRDALLSAIDLGATYLASIADRDGKFTYELCLASGHSHGPTYNMLRHAGTIYAMTMYQTVRPTPANLYAMKRAAKFLRAKAIGPVEGQEGVMATWSRPEVIASTRRPLQAKLGGTGLSLVALIGLEAHAPGSTSIETLRGLGRFIGFMQKDDGSFYSKYIPSGVGRDDSWTSLYYPGEAALGMVMLYEHDPNDEWLQVAANAVGYLATLRKGRTRVEADHWALLATARLLPVYDRVESPPVPREMIVQHARQICHSILGERPRQVDTSDRWGCFGADGRTCPTATRLEGTLAALTFLGEEDAELRAELEQAITAGTAFLLRAQVRDGAHPGAIPQSIHGHPNYRRANTSHDELSVRIDYVQHPLSAFIQYGTRKGWLGEAADGTD